MNFCKNESFAPTVRMSFLNIIQLLLFTLYELLHVLKAIKGLTTAASVANYET